MNAVTIETKFTTFAKTHATDAADTSFPSKVPTLTTPSGDGVIDMGYKGSVTSNGLNLLIIGTGANDAVITGMRVISWRRVPGAALGLQDLWVPSILAEFAAVLGNIPGIAGTNVGSTYFFADTITLVTGNANVSNEIISPTGNVVASIVLDAKGAEKVEITFDLGANATGANCLYARV